MFFLTLLKYVKNISAEKNLPFRQEMQATVNNFAYNNMQSGNMQVNLPTMTKSRRSKLNNYESDDDGI